MRLFFSIFSLAPLFIFAACDQSSSSGGSACPYAFTDGGLYPYESAGAGAVQGSGVSASFCNVGVSLQAVNAAPGGPLVLALDTSTPATLSTVSLPANAVAGTVSGSVEIASLTPGVYKSTDVGACGSFGFSYAVPLSSSTTCEEADAQAGCPTGCTFTFSCPTSSGAGCCLPLGTTYVFEAASATCASSTGPSLGSWSLTLNSFVAEDGGVEGSPVYVPHGSVAATMEGTTGTTNPATLSLTF